MKLNSDLKQVTRYFFTGLEQVNIRKSLQNFEEYNFFPHVKIQGIENRLDGSY